MLPTLPHSRSHTLATASVPAPASAGAPFPAAKHMQIVCNRSAKTKSNHNRITNTRASGDQKVVETRKKVKVSKEG